MSKRTKILIGAGLTALLLTALVVGSALAQGPAPWRSNDNWGRGMTQAPALRSGAWAGVQGNWNQSAPNSNWGPGMMGRGMMGQGWGPGMMDPEDCPMWGETAPTGEPLTLDEALAAAEQYLADYGNDDLEIAEIMQFSENFYVEVHEISSGIGAMELLINPYSGALHPEPGPNMMWNTKYGHMAQGGMTGRGMMGWFRQPSGEVTITADEAIAAAQDWLDANTPGVMAGDEAEPFYGYYTIHTLTDGEISGMLSVNGHTGQVWYHNWHGDFIEMTGEHDE